ncbi:MAG: VCBS repeat-containing protein [Armatimonadetes bacterium]|nr:VCBS repeat-containing protein [Armatimonadota bacterium]
MSASSLLSGDFDGDGNQDLAVLSYFNSVGVMWGRGDGSFEEVKLLNDPNGGIAFVIENPLAIGVGRVNSDSIDDLVIVQKDRWSFVAPGNKDRAFGRTGAVGSGGASPFQGHQAEAVTLADFDGDGKSDIALASSGGVFFVMGNGSETSVRASEFNIMALAAGDLNKDGIPDLVSANPGYLLFGHRGDVSVLIGTKGGQFRPAVQYLAGVSPNSVSIGDFNNDGKPDMNVANRGSRDMSVLFGRGDGTFEPAINYPLEMTPDSLTVGDFNNSGGTDLAVLDKEKNTVRIFLNPYRTSLPRRGDLTNNGEIQVDDVVLALRIAVEMTSPTPAELWAGDVNRNQRVGVEDAVQILQVIVGGRPPWE